MRWQNRNDKKTQNTITLISDKTRNISLNGGMGEEESSHNLERAIMV